MITSARVLPLLPTRGHLVVLEGPDGVGKSEQLPALADALRVRGFDVATFREPGSTPVATALRHLLLTPGLSITPRTEAFGMLMARSDLWELEVLPAVRAGRTALVDRSSLSTLAFQGAGRGVPMRDLLVGCQLAQANVQPTATIVLTAPDAVLDARVRHRAGASDRFESETREFTHRMRGFYRDVGEAAGGVHGSVSTVFPITGPLHAVDASGSREDVAERLLAVANFALGQASNARLAEVLHGVGL
ncbi:MAG: dTMP kinase [Gemmatimonadaceae bacterium]|nr:dTMP kinase [Gemmatimonadaceae bacterium]